MTTIKTRIIVFIVTLGAFVGPYFAVIAVENDRRLERALAEQQAAAEAYKESEASRYQYYLEIADRKNNLKKAMADAKAQYDELLKKQPDLVKSGQHEVAQTTIQPVVTQKTVEVPVTTKVSSAPKSSAKTKTS